RALEDYHRGLVVERLGAAGLGADALRPLERSVVTVAPVAESIRTRLAGMIPLLLVMLAISGAFYPALDLIAGERERGTLESLMSWPVARRDIFLGKLLVTCAAAAISVILNLLSLALTTALAGSQLAGSAGAGVSGMLAVGGGTLLLSFLVLVPITITLAALSLALAGLAASSKEAQNYLSPLLVVVMVAAGVAATPDLRPSLVLDLVPITGSVLVLKESLAGAALPVFHLAMASAASLALAAVVVSWAARLLDSERFRYPGLVRAGWGRFRRWGLGEPLPNGLEVMAVFAIAVGGMTFGAGAFMRWQHQWVPLFVAGPLLLFVALPALAHCWLGAYRARELLQLAWPRASGLLRSGFALPFAVLTSIAIGSLQPAPPPDAAGSGMLEQVVAALRGDGLLVELLCLAVIPGICEELLCRGTLLTGLRRSLGDTGGVLISAFLFATLHLSPYRFLPQFTLGVFLALLTLRTRSLLPAILLHAGHNALAVLLSDHHDALVKILPEPVHRLLAGIAHLPSAVALAIGLAGLLICTSLPRRATPPAA
ncbi:MAG: CPBP family intramembrane metalloprotease, partial [Planctomycetes bacterium]|nr:CPBP family intramembrane metalloprotease [Planctomycetota bacterium]